MTLATNLREWLLAARTRLALGRERIRQQHAAGSPGVQISARLTDLFDAAVLDAYEAALAELPPGGAERLRTEVALVGHSGYGRCDVSPYSDVDLMILHSPQASEEVAPLASRLLRDLCDMGLAVGQSVRTPALACQLAIKDATIFTALVESRFLAGNQRLFETFEERFRRQAQARYKALFWAIDKARRDERQQFGETVYLLEPNLKRSRGGLREIQLLRWIGFARYGASEPDALQLQGRLSKPDLQVLRAAREFLLRVRNELHFHSGKANDVLTRPEQLRLAEAFGYQGAGEIKPVEQFMREYFRHTSGVRSLVADFVAAAQPGPVWQRMLGSVFGYQVERDYLVGPRQIAATRSGLEKLRSDLSEVLRLADLANLHHRRIAPGTWEAVRSAMPTLNGEVTEATCSRFLSLLSQPGHLADLLRRLLELGVLEKVIPAFAHARCLLQFNEYHKYTVDEHCILAVERATQFLDDQGVLGRIYRSLKHKRTLHLALLIHDLGKGFVEDHSEVGRRIAEETGARLRLPAREIEILTFLVHRHLAMAHLAFRHNIGDEQLVLRFAVEVGSPEVLDMLLLLTAADISAVGPDVWNSWKSELLVDLYRRAMAHLSGDRAAADTAERELRRREAVRQALRNAPDQHWFARQIDALPHAYLYGSTPERIAEELRLLHTLRPGEVRATGQYQRERRTVEYVVGTHEEICPGVFHRLNGALTAQGLQILSAEIHTLADALILDRFYVEDPDYADEPPPERIDEVCQALRQALLSPSDQRPAFRQTWFSDAQQSRASLSPLATRVLTDNGTSDRSTIIEVFTHDRRGLLYTITRTLYELGLSVSLAKIGTYLDQVVDVFYVTDQSGRRVQDQRRLEEIRARLLTAIESLSQQ